MILYGRPVNRPIAIYSLGGIRGFWEDHLVFRGIEKESVVSDRILRVAIENWLHVFLGGGGGRMLLENHTALWGGEQVSFYIVIQSKSCTLLPLSQAIINEQSLKAFKQSS